MKARLALMSQPFRLIRRGLAMFRLLAAFSFALTITPVLLASLPADETVTFYIDAVQ
jgi:hypothetical protein